MINHGDNIINLNAILNPGSIYDHPSDVLADSTISIGWRELASQPRQLTVPTDDDDDR